MYFSSAVKGFVATTNKLHPAFERIDMEAKLQANAKQRSRAVCWGSEDDSDVDSDSEDDTDEEAEALASLLTATDSHKRAYRLKNSTPNL